MKGSIALMAAGRRTGMPVVVIDVIDATFVRVDDGRKQRRVNLAHLTFTGKTAKGSDVKSSLTAAGYVLSEKTPHAPKSAVPKTSKPKAKVSAQKAAPKKKA